MCFVSRSLEEAIECTKNVQVFCTAGDQKIDFVMDLNIKLMTAQQILCPNPECDIYTALECLTTVQMELTTGKTDTNRKWCEFLRDMKDDVEDDLDWLDLDDVDDIMCQEYFQCT